MKLLELYENKNKELFNFLKNNYISSESIIDAFEQNVEDFYFSLHGKFKYDFDKYFEIKDDDDIYDLDIELAPEMPIQLLKLFISKYIKTKSGDTELFMRPTKDGILPDNTWLIHFTNFAEDIKNNGFTIGTKDISNLAFTNLNNETKLENGYNFAVELNSPEADQLFKNKRYGLDAVIFQSSGVEVFHRYDKQNQIIFWGKDVDKTKIIIAKRIKDKLVINDTSYQTPSEINPLKI